MSDQPETAAVAASVATAVAAAAERPCSLCDGPLLLSARGPPALVRCTRCGVESLASFPDPRELEALYQEDYYSEETGARFLGLLEWAIARLRHLRVRKIERRRPRGRRILDVGCGRGELLEIFQARGWSALGTQVSRTAAKAARARRHVEVICGELPALALTRAQFDVITFFHVLEHLAQPGEYLQAARELLAPGGLLVVEVPDCSGFAFRRMPTRNLCLDHPHHLHFFGPRSLRALLERHGFTVEGEERFSLEYSPFTCLQNLLNLLPGEPNRLYRSLQRNAAGRALRRSPLTWLHHVLGGALAPAALCLSAAAGLVPPGNTLRYYCGAAGAANAANLAGVAAKP